MYWGTGTQKSRGHLKILGARSVTWSRFHTEDTQVLGGHCTKFSYCGDLAPRFCSPCTRVLALAGKVFCPYAESCYEEIKIGVVFVPESISNISGLTNWEKQGS